MADIETPSVARWSERFVAFLIDVIIISVIGTVFLPGLVSMAYLTEAWRSHWNHGGQADLLSLRVMGIDGELRRMTRLNIRSEKI